MVVVGGGVAAVACAEHVLWEADVRGVDVDVTLLSASDVVKVATNLIQVGDVPALYEDGVCTSYCTAPLLLIIVINVIVTFLNVVIIVTSSCMISLYFVQQQSSSSASIL